jgi:hypothetical protein
MNRKSIAKQKKQPLKIEEAIKKKYIGQCIRCLIMEQNCRSNLETFSETLKSVIKKGNQNGNLKNSPSY